MSWRVFEEAAPELASLGFAKLDRKICYLALTNKDGAPRIHPITPFIGSGMLFMFTEPTSPKIRDLRQDGRYTMHCAMERGSPLEEVLVSGTAVEIKDSVLRMHAEQIAGSPVITEEYVLFEFLLQRSLIVHYNSEKRKVIRRWKHKKD